MNEPRAVPPAFVPTLTEVVPVPVPSIDLLLQRLQSDLAAHLAQRLREQLPVWTEQWVQGLGPELADLAQTLLQASASVPTRENP
jgi:hypothetical protein